MSRMWGERRYPKVPGHVIHSSTSLAAANSMKQHQSDLQLLVLQLFREAGPLGLTDHELQQRGNTRSILRPRRIELTALGKIKPTGERRMTPSGRKAEVWVLS